MSYDRDCNVHCEICGNWHEASSDRLWGMCLQCWNKLKGANGD